MGFFLGDKRPQLVQLTLAQMQVTEEVVHHTLTVLSQHRQPMIHGVFVDAQQPSRGADAHAFRQGDRPTEVGGGLCPDTRIGGACTRRYQGTAGSTTPAESVPMPIMPGELCSRSHLTKEGAVRHTTITGRTIHVAVPPVHIPTVSRGVTYAVVCTYGCDSGRISPTRCVIIDAGLDGRYRLHRSYKTPLAVAGSAHVGLAAASRLASTADPDGFPRSRTTPPSAIPPCGDAPPATCALDTHPCRPRLCLV